jgi:hypothetical protein
MVGALCAEAFSFIIRMTLRQLFDKLTMWNHWENYLVGKKVNAVTVSFLVAGF